MNKNINNSKTIEAIKRYSWVMFNHIDYVNMTTEEKNILIQIFLYFHECIDY